MRTITLLALLLLSCNAHAKWNLIMTQYLGETLQETLVLYESMEERQCGEVLSYLTGWTVGKHDMAVIKAATWEDDNTYEATVGKGVWTVTYTCYEAYKGTT